eukprot:m.126866 g.126866  ORF g.126866 m.126866 type:complete len:104 (-) comp15645_c1_seq3:359-670(-)
MDYHDSTGIRAVRRIARQSRRDMCRPKEAWYQCTQQERDGEMESVTLSSGSSGQGVGAPFPWPTLISFVTRYFYQRISSLRVASSYFDLTYVCLCTNQQKEEI